MQNTNLFKINNDRIKQSYFSNAAWLIILFQILALFVVMLLHIENLTYQSLLFAIGLMVTNIASIFLVKKITNGDIYLLLIVNMIFSIGAIMIYRIDPNLGQRQYLIYLISILAFFIVFFFLRKTKNFWEGKTRFYFIVTLAFFLLTLVFGETISGARNWVSIAGIQIQPSEFAKIPFVFFLASWYQDYEKYQDSLPKKFSLMISVYILIGLFFLQRELGTAIVFFVVLLSTQIAYEKNWKIILVNLGLAVLGLFLAYFLFDHIRVRFEIWKDPWQDYNDKGYQIIQSLFAIAEGGFFGTGLGLGRPDIIPLGHSDFIFASIIEEMGSFMGICVILLFIILVYRGFKIALNQERDFYSCLALAISCMFAAQAFIMFAGVMKVIPLTGITIPFLTYGGSSLLSSFILLAVLQTCSEYD